MKTAAAYIRVSTDDQLEFSPDSQLEKIREYARSHEMFLPEEFIFREDEGVSGRKAEKRPEFMRMIGSAKARPRPFDVILVWKFSRFARNRQDSIVYKSMLRKQQGIQVVSVSEPVGDDKMSVLIEALIEAMDEYYSINLAEEVRRGMTEKAKRGGVVTVPALGYSVENGRFVPNPEEAPLVQSIFQRYAGGMGCFEIARELNAAGAKSRRGNPFEVRTVEYILCNPVYIGKIRWNPKERTHTDYSHPGLMVVDAEHDPLITESLWNAVQVKMEEQKRVFQRNSHTRAKAEFMLRGLVKCSNCGSTLVLTGTKRYAGLQCLGYSHGNCRESHFISLAAINEAVLNLTGLSLPNGTFELREPGHTVPEEEANFLLDRQYAMLERAREAYLAGTDTLLEYQSNKARIREEIRHMEARRPAKAPPEEQRKPLPERTPGLMESLRGGIPEKEKNLLLRSFVHHIVFDRAHSSIQIAFYV